MRYDEHGRPIEDQPAPGAAEAPAEEPVAEARPGLPRSRPPEGLGTQSRSLQLDSATSVGAGLTAMVTLFETDGSLAEERAAELMRHLLEHGSDGLVLAGTTGEGATLADGEMFRLWEIGVDVGGEATVIAGTGTNDTRHSVELTERANDIGVDAVLCVTPYYNKPNRRGLIEHYRVIAASTDKTVILYNIPSRVVIDVPNDLLAELAQIDRVSAVKQANPANLAPVEGLDLLAGNDDMLADVLDIGGAGGILVGSHLVGSRCAG